MGFIEIGRFHWKSVPIKSYTLLCRKTVVKFYHTAGGVKHNVSPFFLQTRVIDILSLCMYMITAMCADWYSTTKFSIVFRSSEESVIHNVAADANFNL